MQGRIVALMLLLVGVTGLIIYSGWTTGRMATQEMPEPEVMHGVLRLSLDDELLDQIQRTTPALTLEADDGTRVIVGAWRISEEQLSLWQFVGVRAAHYRALHVDWRDGSREIVSIDAVVQPAADNWE